MRTPLLRTRRQKGYTLVEMIVATIILFIGVTSAVAAIGNSVRLAGSAQSRSTAAILAQDKFAELEADPTQMSLGETDGDFGNEHPAYTWRELIEQTTQADLYKVTLTIEWQDGARLRQAQFVTYEPTTLLSSQATSSGSGGAASGGGQ